MQLFHKKSSDLPPEVEQELKKVPRKNRKKAKELYKLYTEGKIINLKEEISKK